MKQVFTYFIENKEFFTGLLLDHLKITVIASVLAIIFGIFIGIIISEKKKIANLVISAVNVLYTIPSIALLGALISVTGIGNTTAIIALSLYALLPVVRSTYTGINNIDDKIIEASRAMGSTKAQILYKIKLPLAFPVIFSAIRNMVTMTVALAGIASFVGAGGLGVAIYRGITTNNQTLLLTGSILIAGLALAVDGVLGILEKQSRKRHKKKIGKAAYIAVSLIAVMVASLWFGNAASHKQVIQLASKPITESYILAEIVARVIEDNTNLSVNITHGVGGGTSNLHPALVRGDFDIYPEYTGTAWQIVLKEPGNYENGLFDKLQQKYRQNYNIHWKGMFGFNNTYGLAVQKEVAQAHHLKTYSDLAKVAPDLVFGAEYDFFEREDGFNALSKAYGFRFKQNVDMDNGLKYQAILDKKIDVMTVFTTDGQLADPRIVVLEDDLQFYPSYMAGMVIRGEILDSHPEMSKALDMLEGKINEEVMAKMNHQVEIEKMTPEQVAREFVDNAFKQKDK